MNAVLVRRHTGVYGTFSTLIVSREPARQWWVAEPPDKKNLPNESCIPPGRYEVIHHTSPRFGKCLKVLSVPGRTDILWHPGNFAGDESLGLKSDTDGCLIPGNKIGWLDNQQIVQESRNAFEEILRLTPSSGMTLEIIDLIQKGVSSSS